MYFIGNIVFKYTKQIVPKIGDWPAQEQLYRVINRFKSYTIKIVLKIEVHVESPIMVNGVCHGVPKMNEYVFFFMDTPLLHAEKIGKIAGK